MFIDKYEALWFLKSIWIIMYVGSRFNNLNSFTISVSSVSCLLIRNLRNGALVNYRLGTSVSFKRPCQLSGNDISLLKWILNSPLTSKLALMIVGSSIVIMSWMLLFQTPILMVSFSVAFSYSSWFITSFICSWFTWFRSCNSMYNLY